MCHYYYHHHYYYYHHHHRRRRRRRRCHRRRLNDLVGPYTMYNGKFQRTFQSYRLLPSSGKWIRYRRMPVTAA
jgi:hypothetical protein